MLNFLKRIFKLFNSNRFVEGSYIPPRNSIPPPAPEVWEEVCEKRKSRKKKTSSKKKKAKKLL